MNYLDYFKWLEKPHNIEKAFQRHGNNIYNAKHTFDDTGEYMQNYKTESSFKLNGGNKLIGSYMYIHQRLDHIVCS